MKRRTEITIETHEMTVISTSREKPANGYCPSCGSHVSVWPTSQMAGFLRVTGDEVLYGVGDTLQQIREPREPDDLICGNSLGKRESL